MKSAYERALERFGGEPLRELTASQKAKIAELESYYKSKRAEAEFAAARRLEKAADPGEAARVREDLAVELAAIESKLEQEKEKVRGGA